MSSGGAEALKAAIRRSLPIIVALVVLGVVAVNVFKHVQGPKYSSSARVQVSTTSLASIITGTQAAFVDPQRSQDTALALAQSSQVYGIAAGRNPAVGSASALAAATGVTAVPDTDILQFTAISSRAGRAITTANAVSSAYVAYRAQLTSSQVTQTIAKLQTTRATLPAGTQRTQIERELDRLRVLQGTGSSDAVIVQRASSADQTSPAPLKDSILGWR
jgi:uncharacterized protein involved in exopolysaccharide biosynthesis